MRVKASAVSTCLSVSPPKPKINNGGFMSESKHTPGPWEVSIGDDYGITAEAYPKEYSHSFKSDDLGYLLALVGNRAEDFGKANARLIAAAPDLLAALEALSSNPHLYLGDLVYAVREKEGEGWDGPAVTAWSEAVMAAKAAIAKARGE
jgi:hypothetical protein